ncbi:hypothetical protein V8F33_014076 [Rhypophila sp. PSN 637]
MVYPQRYSPRGDSGGGRTSSRGGVFQQEPFQNSGPQPQPHDQRTHRQQQSDHQQPHQHQQQSQYAHRSPIQSPTQAYSPIRVSEAQSQQFESRSLATTRSTKTRGSNNGFKSPFSSWVTQLARALLAVLEVGAMGFGCFFLVKWQPTKNFPTSRYELSVATVGVALALDLSAVILSTCKKYGLWWITFMVLADVGIGIMGVLGVVRVYSTGGMDGRTEDELGWKWGGMGRLVGLFGVICGAFHILFAFLGCIGCVMIQTGGGKRRPMSFGWTLKEKEANNSDCPSRGPVERPPSAPCADQTVIRM